MAVRTRSALVLFLVCVLINIAAAQSVVHDVIYEKLGGAAFTMDVFKPAKPNGTGLIWLVSGGWVSSHGDINPQVAQILNAQGITVFEVVHGSQPKYVIPEILAMLTHAVRFIHLNAASYGVDPSRLGISGVSSGGHLSLMLAAMGDAGDPKAKDPVDQAPSTLKAVAVFFPPTDFLNWGASGALPFDRPELQIFKPAFGLPADATEDKRLEIARALSPIYRITSTFPPVLIVHGDKDTLVPIQQAQSIDAALTKAGVKHKLVVIPGGGHDGVTIAGGAKDYIAWLQANL